MNNTQQKPPHKAKLSLRKHLLMAGAPFLALTLLWGAWYTLPYDIAILALPKSIQERIHQLTLPTVIDTQAEMRINEASQRLNNQLQEFQNRVSASFSNQGLINNNLHEQLQYLAQTHATAPSPTPLERTTDIESIKKDLEQSLEAKVADVVKSHIKKQFFSQHSLLLISFIKKAIENGIPYYRQLIDLEFCLGKLQISSNESIWKILKKNAEDDTHSKEYLNDYYTDISQKPQKSEQQNKILSMLQNLGVLKIERRKPTNTKMQEIKEIYEQVSNIPDERRKDFSEWLHLADEHFKMIEHLTMLEKQVEEQPA